MNGVEIRFEEVSGHSWCLSTSAVVLSALWSFVAVEYVEIESGSACFALGLGGRWAGGLVVCRAGEWS